MRILYIETRKWTAEITSSDDNRKGHAARTSPSFRAELDSGPVPATRNTRVVRSCRVGRYRLKFSRLTHTRTAVAVDDPTFIKPPLYSQDREIAKVPLELDSAGCPSELASPHPTSLIVELPTERSERLLSKSVRACYQSSPCVHELPGSAPMMSLDLHSVGIFELDSQIPTNLGRQDYSAQLTQDFYIPEILEPFHKGYQLALAEASNAELVPIPSLANHLRLPISSQAGSTPGTISSYQSSTPSPVSPMTPNLEAVQYSPTQRQPDVSPVNSFESPDQLFSTPLEHFSIADDQDQVLETKNYEAAIMTLESPLRNESSGWQQHTHEASSLSPLEHGSSSGPQGCYESFEPEPSDEFSGRAWGDFGGFVPNNDSLGVGSRYHTIRNGQEALTSGQFACPPVPALAYPRSVNCAVGNFQYGQEQQLVHRVPPTPLGLGTTRHNADCPMEVCAICETQFTGKYAKGNCRRHKRQKHSEVQSLHGKTCRKCDKTFNRADAKRKHEWKKHRLDDSRPHKRRKEQ